MRRALPSLLLAALAASGALLAAGASWLAAALGAVMVLVAAAVPWLFSEPEPLPRLPPRAPAAEPPPQDQELIRLAAALDGMREGVWITDAEGTVIRHNDALKELLHAGHTLVGQRPLELLRDADLHDAVARACREGAQTQLEVAVEGLYPRALAVSVSPMRGGLGGSTAVFHDITELRRLEKVRTDFVANVSHELRTPITAILGYAETLADGALRDAQAAPKMVEVVLRQSKRLSELVDDLLELSRIESHQLQLKPKAVALAELAARVAEALRPKSEPKQIRVELALSPSLEAWADERAVERILINLLDNAVKYTPPGGRIEISALAEQGRVALKVRDTGVGIDAKHLPRLFERFYRVDAGRSREIGGTGLGLAIVKHLALEQHGDVKVDSEPGAGSAFTVFLPVPGVTQALRPE